MSEYGWADFIRQNQSQRSAVIKAFAITAERLAKIKASKFTKRIRYPEHKDAFDYVHELYPVANVRQSMIYNCPKALLHDIGYGGVGGFYDTVARAVVITDFIGDGEYGEFDIKAEFTIDEVLCHELIHFGANYKLPTAGRNVEEEIAYGKSIGYLRSRGRTDAFIINKNMLPYLISVVDKGDVYRKVLLKHFDEKLLSTASYETICKLLEPLGSEVFRQTKSAAVKLGERMIAVYGGGEAEEKRTMDQCHPLTVTRNKLIIDDFEV